MIMYIAGFVLLGFGLSAVALQRLYSAVPVRELKRLATEGDGLAKALYGPVAYGRALRAFLWTVAGLGLASGLVLLSSHLPLLIAAGVAMLALLAAMVVLPQLELGLATARVAVFAAPAVRWVLGHTFVFWEKLSAIAGKRHAHTNHTHLYDKQDLRNLLQRQRGQHDNRMNTQELDQIDRTLAFHEKKAADVATPRQKIRLLASTEAIGPVLLGELHASGQQNFFVYENTPENIVGVLHLRDAVSARAGGLVGQLVQRDVCYVHEDFSLHRALEALRHTRQQLAIVVNSFEEIVGTLSLDHLMHELFGERNSLEPDMDYESRASVGGFRVQPVLANEPTSESILESGDADQILQALDGLEQPTDAPASPETPEVVK